MKKTLLATGLVLAIASISNHSLAEEDLYLDHQSTASITKLKEGISFGAGSIIGAVLAGPIGFMLGSAAGSVLGLEFNKADQYDVVVKTVKETEAELKSNQKSIRNLQQQLQLAQLEQKQLQQMAMTHLEFQVLFSTGDDVVDGYTSKPLDKLAEFLNRNPELNIRLHGHADPRGTDEYNNVLSMHRAINVQQALEQRGVDSSRITRLSYGSGQSDANQGDIDAYALERRVSIEIFDNKNGFASVDNR